MMGTRACEQPSLYEFDPALPQVGSVVQQRQPWIGYCQLITPFWVVTNINHVSDSFKYLCLAIPFGLWPDDRHWFGAGQIELLGFSIPLPSDNELEASFGRAGRHNPFAARLCRAEDGNRYVSAYDWDNFEPEPKPEPLRCHTIPRGYYVPASLVDLDVPIVAELEARGLPWQVGAVTRQNFFEVLS